MRGKCREIGHSWWLWLSEGAESLGSWRQGAGWAGRTGNCERGNCCCIFFLHRDCVNREDDTMKISSSLPSTPSKLWMCRLTPILKCGNCIFFPNASWETEHHSLHALFQGFESIWAQPCPSCSASFCPAAGIAGRRTSSSCVPGTADRAFPHTRITSWSS